VENHAHIPAALAQLRCSMQDPVVAIDLEWRPEFGRGFTPVAMVQLASSRCVQHPPRVHPRQALWHHLPALRTTLQDHNELPRWQHVAGCSIMCMSCPMPLSTLGGSCVAHVLAVMLDVHAAS